MFRKTTAIIVCSIMAISCMPVYADAVGSIKVEGDISAQSFSGEIYVILSDNNGNVKLAILNPKNHFQFNLSNLEYGRYEVKEVHVYNTSDEASEDRKEIKTDYTIETDYLDLNADNNNLSVKFILNSIKNGDEKQSAKETTTNEKKEEQTELENKEDLEKQEVNKQEEEENKKKQEDFVARRKRRYFINFIIDATLILGLGGIWFFKIREKKHDDGDSKDKIDEN